MEIHQIEIFRIDILLSEVDRLDQSAFPPDFKNYFEELITMMTAPGKGRAFCFDRTTTEVRAQIGNIDDLNFSQVATTISQRLLVIEQKVQDDMAQLQVEIQKGIVIQTLVTDNEKRLFIICKADYNDFLDELDFHKTKGLPIKKKVFKGFSCIVNVDNTVTDVFVYDPRETKYWWDDFLELSYIFTDEDNTENAFEAIEKKVLVKLKKKSPQDYMHLTNTTIHYFRTNQTFVLEEYLDDVIRNYEPYDIKIKTDELESSISALPSTAKNQFDTQFSIVKNKIRKRFIKDISLTPQIELRFKEDIPDLENVVIAEKDSDGTKYVKIRSDEGYKYFNEKHQNTKEE